MKAPLLSKTLLVVSSFLFLGNCDILKAQCVASFSHTSVNHMVTYTNNSVSSGSAMFYWTFNGGSPGVLVSGNPNSTPQVSYSTPGTYTTCLITVDTLWGCSDTVCDSITVTPGTLQTYLNSWNASCGLCNGGAWVVAYNYVSPLTYSWSNGGTSQNAPSLCSGYTTVTVTDNFGNVGIDTAFIDSLTTFYISGYWNVSGCPDDTLSMTASPTSGIPPFAYTWSNGDTTQYGNLLVPASNTTTNYTLTITDVNGCTGAKNYSVSGEPLMSLSTSGVDETCLGCCNGTASVSFSGGVGSNPSYQWSTGSTTANAYNLCPGSYYVTVTDDSTLCPVVDTVVIDSGVPGVCGAVIGASLSGNTATFSNYSGTSGFATTYYWSFPGGSPSADTTYNLGTSPQVTYASPGTYPVCMIVVDSLWSCTDTVCDSITFNTSSLTVWTYGNLVSCGQCDGSATTYATGGTLPYTYSWNTGATTGSINNLCAGVYSVTLTDAFGQTGTAQHFAQSNAFWFGGMSAQYTACLGGGANVCPSPSGGTAPYTYAWSNGMTSQCNYLFNSQSQGSTTYTVTITDASGCVRIGSSTVSSYPDINTTFTTVDETCANCCDGSIGLTVTGGSGNGFNYNWNTGQTTANLSNLCDGTYSVTITDVSTSCWEYDYVNIGNQCTGSVSGSITPQTQAKVFLIKESGGILSLAQSVNTDTSGYHFGAVCPGTYYVKAALRPASPQYYNYLPTYYTNQALWANATPVSVSTGATTGINFSLLSGTNPGGPGFIGGLISQGANRGEGDPVAGAQVFLMNGNGEALTSTTSDTTGNYAFDGLPVGDYKVYVDLLNYIPYPHTVTVSESSATFDTKNFIVEGGAIKPVDPVGVKDVAAGSGISVYPNPANERLTVRGANITAIVLYNLLGEPVISETLSSESLKVVSLKGLAPGQYILEVTSGGTTVHQTVVKQ